MDVKTLMQVLRVKQWVKNLFVFVPLVFSGKMLDPALMLESAGAFAAFCLMASSIYIINDLRDREADRQHPVKRTRPIASGKVGTAAASVLSLLLCAMSFATAWGCGFDADAYLILGGYLAMNLLYSFGLKHVAILDVIIIAAGFVLRVVFGGVATHVWVTPWLVMMVFLLTLLIGFGKRRDDLLKMEREDVDVRRSVQEYNLTFINQVLGILAATVIVAYISYTLTSEVEERFRSGNVYLTSVFVIGAVLRYLQIALVQERTGSPTQLVYNDRFIQICCILWLASFLFIIYAR